MITKQHFRIVGTGSYLPGRIVTSEEIDRRARLPAGWTAAHSGVLRRHECVVPETIVTMGREALHRALNDAHIGWKELDLIIDCSTSRFRPIPCNAAHLQHAAGGEAAGIPCYDIQSTCLGFIVAVNVANALMGSDAYRHIAIVASESGLTGVNWEQPESAGLMGDGAAAAVLRRTDTGKQVFYSHETYAEHMEACRVNGGGHHLPAYHFHEDRRGEFLFDMDGPAVFRVAIRRLPRMVRALVDEWTSHPEIGQAHVKERLHVVPHQASPKALETVRRFLEFSTDQFHVDMELVGNMIAASVPWMLDRCRRESLVHPGDSVMLLGTSAGYSQAALIMEM